MLRERGRCDLKKIATFVEHTDLVYRAGKLLSLGISSSELEKKGRPHTQSLSPAISPASFFFQNPRRGGIIPGLKLQ